MCVTWTTHYACGHDEAAKAPSNGCDGKCTGANITYDDNLDTSPQEDCSTCIAARQLQTPPTSSDSSASETSEE
jgi:hypothetical protein